MVEVVVGQKLPARKIEVEIFVATVGFDPDAVLAMQKHP
jgi:hypothetical protein